MAYNAGSQTEHGLYAGFETKRVQTSHQMALLLFIHKSAISKAATKLQQGFVFQHIKVLKTFI